MRTIGLPRSFSAAKSPAAWAWMSRGSRSPVGDRQLLAGSSTTWTNTPGRRPALVELAGRVQVARPEAGGDDAAGLPARALASGVELGLARRVDERLDGDVVARPRLGEQLLDATPRTVGVRPRPWPERTSRVRSLASCTFGWSNGLISRSPPRPRSRTPSGRTPGPARTGAGTRTSRRLAVGALGRLARRRDEPLALLARRLGEKLLHPEPEAARVGTTTLSRPSSQPCPSARPSSRPGFPSEAGTRPPSRPCAP